MDPTAIKLECLKLASERLPEPAPTKIVEAAEAYWLWITDAASIREPRPNTEDSR